MHFKHLTFVINSKRFDSWEFQIRLYQRIHKKAVVTVFKSYLIVIQSLIRRLDLEKGIQRTGRKWKALWNCFSWHRKFSEHGKRWKTTSSFRGTFPSDRTNNMFFTCSVFAWWYYNWIFFIEWWLDLNSTTIIRENSSNEQVRHCKFSRVKLSPWKMTQRKKSPMTEGFYNLHNLQL